MSEAEKLREIEERRLAKLKSYIDKIKFDKSRKDKGFIENEARKVSERGSVILIRIKENEQRIERETETFKEHILDLKAKGLLSKQALKNTWLKYDATVKVGLGQSDLHDESFLKENLDKIYPASKKKSSKKSTKKKGE